MHLHQLELHDDGVEVVSESLGVVVGDDGHEDSSHEVENGITYLETGIDQDHYPRRITEWAAVY